jgi:hypothetical protein
VGIVSTQDSPGRWGRLAADLAATGIDARVIERPWTEVRYGRMTSGVSRSIVIKHPAGGTVEVHDKWWRKNLDVWIGWAVHVEGPDSIEIRHWPLTKKRSEAVAAVRQALESR